MGTNESVMNKSHFTMNNIIGIGSLGKVWKVQSKLSKNQFALKALEKAKVVKTHSVDRANRERRFLSMLKHPFLVNMIYAFQDKRYLYLVLDLMKGGDLRRCLALERRFTEEQSKFIVACLLTAVEYIHHCNIVHRDLTPENLLFDHRGYLRVVDFAMARHLSENDTVYKTSEYTAPEIMCGQDHGISADYFSVGVITYEILLGERPFKGKNSQQVKKDMLSKRVQIQKRGVFPGLSVEAADFINKLLEPNPNNRLGAHGASEVKQHAWFRGFDWRALFQKKIQPPYEPKEYTGVFSKKKEQVGEIEAPLFEAYEYIAPSEGIHSRSRSLDL